MSKLSSILLLLLLLSTLFFLSASVDTLSPSQPLADGQTLVSAGGSFALGFFSPANTKNRYVGIWYNKIPIQTVVWVANRQSPIGGPTGVLSISTNGSLVITGHNSTVVWSSAAPVAGDGVVGPVAQLLDNGNLVVRDESSTEVGWQSFDYPTDALLPGMKLGWNLASGLNRNLTAWRSPSDPSPGNYCMWLDIQGDPQVFLQNGPDLIWRAGPWDGVRFTGIPEMKTYNAFNFTFVNTADEIYYTFHILNNSIISRLVADGSGTTQRLVWLDESGSWNVFWFAPKDPCDDVSPCGPYGVCNANDSPICNCLQGFEPKSPYNWAMRDGRGGCVRRTPVDCRNGTDGFVAVSQAKLPDTTKAVVNVSMGLDECRAACLSNCSCTAYTSADISEGGSGCINWLTELTDLRVYTDNGQDLYVRLAAADLGSNDDEPHKKGEVIIIIITVASILGALLLAWISCLIWRKQKIPRRAMLNTGSFTEHYKDETKDGNDLELPLVDLDTIMTATNDFSIQNKLGQGGFGPVYKGNLGEGNDIAVKRLAKTSVQGADEFKNEVVLIAKLQHRNLVRLLGCCIQGEERILIYEYMPNKSLDAFLFDKEKGAELDWQIRYHIIVGIARGLLYLHQDSRFRIIHRDLKASNILLDKDMNPKISDFGMARMFGGDETEVNTKKVVGTYGYMSPEYAMDGIISVKSDVFSFGVLVLEIISGKKNRGFYLSEPHLNLLGHAWSLWKEGKGLEFVDASTCSSLQMVEVMRCIKVGLLCVQERPEDRPTMSSVVLMLASENVVLPHPKQPGFVAKRCSFDMDSSSSKSLTVNQMTVTIFEGR